MNKQTHVEPETRHILPYLSWTFGISWGSWLILYILAALKLTSGAEPLGFALLLIGGFGPALGTFISLKISHPKKMLDFIFSHAKGWWIYMLAFCLVRVLTLFIANPVLPPLNAVLMFPLGWTFVTFFVGRERRAGLAGSAAAGSGEKILLPSGNCHHGSGLGGLASAPLADSGNESRSAFFALLSLLWYLALFLSGGSLQADGLCLCLHGLSRLH